VQNGVVEDLEDLRRFGLKLTLNNLHAELALNADQAR
jgi:hypothetical protein